MFPLFISMRLSVFQAQLFGPAFRRSGLQAERDALAVLSSASFRQAEQQLKDAYSGATRAWSLGLEKYPAIVFDDQFVVYGTTDVALAEQRLKAWQEGQR